MKQLLFTCLLSFQFYCLFGQSDLSWQTFHLNREVSLRGIAAVTENECWVSGTNGTLAKTNNGGDSWTYFKLPDADSLDFRDIEVLNEREVLILSVGNGASSKIFKTNDGGKNWKVVFENVVEEGFFDAFTFWNEKEGMMQGDPIDGRLYLLTTTDGGGTWQKVPNKSCPKVNEGEYAFAASGTQITSLGKTIWIGTGGSKSQVFKSNSKSLLWESIETEMIHGEASQGIFSLAFANKKMGMAVGGDYTKPDQSMDNLLLTLDGGKSWHLQRSDLDYRSSVAFVHKTAVVTGPSGSEWSSDKGNSWKKIKGKGFNSLSVVKNSKSVWAAGSEGRVGKLLIK